MPNILESFISTIIAPGFGSAEFFVAALVACGLIMIVISSLLPKTASDELEWWER
jgi:Mg2+/Co2+ transporter CorB